MSEAGPRDFPPSAALARIGQPIACAFKRASRDSAAAMKRGIERWISTLSIYVEILAMRSVTVEHEADALQRANLHLAFDELPVTRRAARHDPAV